MRTHELGLALTAAGLFEDPHYLHQGARIIARLSHKANAQPVGLEFIGPAVLHIYHGTDELYHLGALCAFRRVGVRGGLRQTFRQFALGDSLRGVPGHRVADLMGQDARQLGPRLQAFQERCRNEYLAAGKRKGVYVS